MIDPLVIQQYDLWGNLAYIPIIKKTNCTKGRIVESMAKQTLSKVGDSFLKKKKLRYLNKHYIPHDWPVEGVEEFPCVQRYNGPLPKDVIGFDESKPRDCSQLGLHGFCYDHVLEAGWHNIYNLVAKAKHFLCAFGPDFSVLTDGRRCDAVEAIRRNRIMTLSLQLSGIPTIQSASWGNVNSFDYTFDGLASNSPTAIEHNANSKDPAKRRLFRLGVEELVTRKCPTVLIVVGFNLDFDPGVPVVNYKSRIQKFRETHG